MAGPAGQQRPGAAPNLIDRLVGYFAPMSGLRRTLARDQLKRAYEGAIPRDGWRPARSGASANTDHAMDARELRVRARALVQNVPYITRAIETLVSYTVGTGIAPRSLEAPALAARIDALWDRWVQQADADGLGNFYSLQARAYRAMEVDGEVLIRIRPRTASDGLAVPMQLQLLEIDWLDDGKNGNVGGNTIVNGIEYNPLGQVSAYWLFDQHPGEMRGRLNRSASRPVPAGRVIHLFNPARPGQGRGFSRLAPVIARVRDLQLYEDAEISRKNLETRMGVLASGDLSQLQQGDGAAEAMKPGELGQLASGGITAIPAGMNITVIEPKAAPGYVEYVSQFLHLISAGIGVPYESMTGDMSGVNMSSARIRRIDFKRDIESVGDLTGGNGTGMARAVSVQADANLTGVVLIANNVIESVIGEEGDAIVVLSSNGSGTYYDLPALIVNNAITTWTRRAGCWARRSRSSRRFG
jgi:lambda family phage portal protein